MQLDDKKTIFKNDDFLHTTRQLRKIYTIIVTSVVLDLNFVIKTELLCYIYVYSFSV